MGAGASTLPLTLDKASAQAFAGDKFDEAAFDKAAVDGTVSRDAFLAAASSTAPSSPFRDEAFPPDAKALGMTPAEMERQGITWRRTTDLFQGAPLLPTKPGHEVVVQGQLNDCYVAAGLALVASTSDLSGSADRREASLVEPGEVEGQFVVTLFAGGGEKRVVTVDDMIPVSATGEPLYAHARDGACLAFSLIEKALAKHYGSFAALNGGNTSEALWDLTGCAVEDIKLDGDGASKVSPSACATMVGDAIKRGDLIACGFIDTKKRGEYAAVCEGGVRMNHAFAVVGASAKEAIVYNPMGVDDGYTNGKTDGAGTLTMAWSEFTKSFSRLQLCRRSARATLPFHRSWRSGGEGGEGPRLSWTEGHSAGGCTTFTSFRRNPMLRLPRCGDAKRKVTIEAVVGQRDRRGDNSQGALSYPQLGMCVVRLKNGAQWPCVTVENYEVVAKSAAFWNKREVAARLEVDLSAAGETYLVPSTFHPEEAGDFWLSARSSVALDGAEWLSTMTSQASVATWKGESSSNTVRLGVSGATAGRLCAFVRQTTGKGEQAETSAAEKRVPLGVYLLDGEEVVQPAQFCKAGEVSVSFELDETRAASPHLAVAPCTFAADKGVQLEVEVVLVPKAAQSAAGGSKGLQLSASKGVDPKTLSKAGTSAGAAPAGTGKPGPEAKGKAGTKPKGAAKGKAGKGGGGGAAAPPTGDAFGGMMGAKKTVTGMAGLYGALE